MNAAMSYESDPLGDWPERLGEPGATINAPTVAEEARFPGAMVCGVAVGLALLAAACFVRWAVSP